MLRTQISLTEEQMRQLKTLSAERGESIAEIIRQAIDTMIQSQSFTTREQQRQRALAAAGRFTLIEPDANVSRDHDNYLDEAYSAWQSS